MNTGVKVTPSDWNPDKEKVRKSHRNCNSINNDLQILKDNANEARRKLARQKKENASAIKKLLETSSRDNFFDLADDYLDDLKKAEQFHTHKQSRVAVEKVRNFHKSDHLPINLIDEAWLNKLVKYMQGPAYANKASTIHKNFGAISGILDKAVSHKLISYNPAASSDFSLPKKNGTTTKAKLNYEQMQALESVNLEPGSNLWHARNAFVLAYYFCGIRFGDLAMLRWENVKNDRLRYTMSKTGNDVDVKIPDGAKRYLELYKGDDIDDNDYIFPFLSDLTPKQQEDGSFVRKRIATWNTMVNGQDSDGKLSGLKEIADMVGIDENLSMHVARHSFAQYAIEEKEVPVYRMMILLGHQNIKTTMQYLKTINVKAADEAIDAIF